MKNIFKTIFESGDYKPENAREEKIIKIVEEFCKNPEARISVLFDGKCYLTLIEQHYDIIITRNYVTIANTNRVTREFFEIKFCDKLRSIVDKRAKEDLRKVLSNIEERDNALLDMMLASVTPKQTSTSVDFDDGNVAERIIHT